MPLANLFLGFAGTLLWLSMQLPAWLADILVYMVFFFYFLLRRLMTDYDY
jgi:hypothetical protein